MSDAYKKEQAYGRGVGMGLGTVGVLFVVALLGGSLWGCPQYTVYSQTMSGKAKLREAEYTRRTAVLEAQARLDSAKLDAQAEVARAKGTNEANHIMAQALGGPDNYLRWSYIHMLEKTAGQGDRQIIYLPTEAGMPILEAGRRPAPSTSPP